MATAEYVLGTHDEEVERLGLQHRVWRDRAIDAWRRAGFGPGQMVLDVGCGPGFAAADLAAMVARVVAVDQSPRFLAALKRDRASANIETHQIDLDTDELPVRSADGAWVRWVFAFVRNPRALLERVLRALKPGGTLVIHEYFDYQTWHFAERSDVFENFVATVMRSWRSLGGEPNIGRDLLTWLGDRVVSAKPIVEVITPEDFMWQWPKTFVNVGVKHLVELGEIEEGNGRAVVREFDRLEATAGVRMFTPAVVEIICS